ncbi:MAG: methyltransferase domain-containing protein [Panacagrimonas sp.]
MDGTFNPHQSIQDYYGKLLQSSADLKTSACCLTESPSPRVLAALANVHEDVKNRFYGCGSPIPPALTGLSVLDLGCGSGRDCYVLAQLVGPQGEVTGLDMTDEQLDVARRTQAWHAERFGYANTRFVQGYIERLAGIADASVDLVVSNCVINLSPDKLAVFGEIFRVLKPGGELYFSDVFSDRRIPPALATDPVMLGECLGGALYLEDFRRLMAEVGCLDARFVASSPLAINNPELERQAGNIRFSSRTVRAFKLELEDRCEDYGQVATYLGTVPESPHFFDLDDHHHFVAGKPMLVCGNTADMLGGSRYASNFRVQGEKARHFGLFDCAPEPGAAAITAGSCC